MPWQQPELLFQWGTPPCRSQSCGVGGIESLATMVSGATLVFTPWFLVPYFLPFADTAPYRGLSEHFTKVALPLAFRRLSTAVIRAAIKPMVVNSHFLGSIQFLQGSDW